MNPVLRKIAKGNLQAGELAELLHKHLGNSPSEYLCKQALDALARTKQTNAVITARVAAALFAAGPIDPTGIYAAIEALENFSSSETNGQS